MRLAVFILTDYPWRSGGMNQALHNLVGFLASRGHEIDVYALENHTATPQPIFEVPAGVTLVPVRVPLLKHGGVPVLGGFATLFSILSAPRAMVRAARRRPRPDAIVAEFTCADAALSWGARDGIPVAVLRWAHWASELSRTGRLFRALSGYWDRRERAVFAATRCLVLDGPDLLEDALATGVDPSVACLVPGSVDVARFSSAPRQSAALERAGVTGRKVLLFPSMLRDIKGFDHLLRAYASLPGEVREGAVVVATGRQNQDPYRRLAAELGIEDGVVFLGELPAAQLPSLFAASYVAVFPYLFGAGYSVAGIESMAAGLPLVAYDVQAFGAIVEDGVTGALVPVGDERALAAALERVLADEAARDRMGAASGEAAREFDITRVGARFETVLTRLVAGELPCA